MDLNKYINKMKQKHEELSGPFDGSFKDTARKSTSQKGASVGGVTQAPDLPCALTDAGPATGGMHSKAPIGAATDPTREGGKAPRVPARGPIVGNAAGAGATLEPIPERGGKEAIAAANAPAREGCDAARAPARDPTKGNAAGAGAVLVPKPRQDGSGDNGSRSKRRRAAQARRKQAMDELRHLQDGRQTEVVKTPGTSKRMRETSDNSPSEQEVKKPRKGSYSYAAGSKRMAVVMENHPDTVIEQGDVQDLHLLIFEALEEATAPPILNVVGLVEGALHIQCVGNEAAKWLGANIGNKTFKGTKLKVVDACDLPKPVKMAWKSRIVAIDDTARAMKMLQRLNPALKTHLWKVVNTLKEGTGIRRIVYMDRVSANHIKERGYALPGGLDVQSFKLLEDNPERKTERLERPKTTEAENSVPAKPPPTETVVKEPTVSTATAAETEDDLTGIEALYLGESELDQSPMPSATPDVEYMSAEELEEEDD